MSATEAFFQTQIDEMKKQFRLAQATVSNHARNALVALDEGDEDTVREILKAMIGGGE